MPQNRASEIEQSLRSAGVYQRWVVMNELATYPATVAVPIFKRLLNEQDVGLRRLAVVGLSKHLTDETFETLIALLQSNGDPIILAEAANAIFDFGDVAIAPLQQLFDRASQPALWQIRQTIMALFVETQRYDILLGLATTALADETPVVQEIAIGAFAQMLQSNLKSAVLDRLIEQASADNWQVRRCVALVLYTCLEPAAKQAIAQLLKDADFRVVAAALEGVGIEEREIE